MRNWVRDGGHLRCTKRTLWLPNLMSRSNGCLCRSCNGTSSRCNQARDGGCMRCTKRTTVLLNLTSRSDRCLGTCATNWDLRNGGKISFIPVSANSVARHTLGGMCSLWPTTDYQLHTNWSWNVLLPFLYHPCFSARRDIIDTVISIQWVTRLIGAQHSKWWSNGTVDTSLWMRCHWCRLWYIIIVVETYCIDNRCQLLVIVQGIWVYRHDGLVWERTNVEWSFEFCGGVPSWSLCYYLKEAWT